MPEIRDDCVPDEQVERQLMDLRAASDIVLGSIDVAPGVQPHVHATNDLPGAAGASCSLRTSISNCMSFLNPAGVRMPKFLGSSSRLMSMIFWYWGSMADPCLATGTQGPSEVHEAVDCRAIAASASRERVASMIDRSPR